MNQVQVDVGHTSYQINIGRGRLDMLHTAVPVDASTLLIVTNQTVAPLYAERAKQSLLKTGKRVLVLSLPDGESYKNWETLNLIFDALLQAQCDRHVVLVALGGGVIGDMTGFAASVYMRGVRFIQVPTTILAQVDSSVGGKTAVNHPLGKNMVGTFYQPIAVEIDTDVLSTLPAREVSAGLAEVIKYGLILDAGFFTWCEQHAADLLALDTPAITYAIARSCELKAWVVSQDERETGLRAVLNLGHTFGHAIESGLGYGVWLHGEAVGCGMVLAASLSALELGLAEQEVSRVRDLVTAIGCPVVAPDLGEARWMALMQVDKKNQAGQIRFILLNKIGSAVVQTASASALQQVLSNCTSL